MFITIVNVHDCPLSHAEAALRRGLRLSGKFPMSFSNLWQRLCDNRGAARSSDPCCVSDDAGKASSESDEESNCSSCRTTQSNSSASGSDSRDSSGSTHGDDMDPAAVRKLERRRRQTAAARAASLKSRARKQMAKQYALPPPPKPGEEYIVDLQPSELTNPGHRNYTRQRRLRRLRLIHSWFKAVCCFLSNLFEKPVHHVLSVSVIDDTNMRLSKTVDGAWKSSRVMAVLNNCQTCIVGFQADGGGGSFHARCQEPDDESYAAFVLHTPMICLPRANAPVVLRELCGWLLSFLGIVGHRWQALGLRSNLLDGVPLVGQLLCYDSLSTNVRITKVLRFACVKHRMSQTTTGTNGADSAYPLMGIFCGIHQLALARKSLLFFHSGVWSSIVRLAHLFSSNNFRTQFRRSLFTLLADSFSYIGVTDLPPDHSEWYFERASHCSFLTTNYQEKSLRFNWHLKLAKLDNGDCRSDQIVHWCKGQACCKGRTPEERGHSALLLVVKYYYFLLGFGFAVPLTYRWKHAGPALQYVQAPCWQ